MPDPAPGAERTVGDIAQIAEVAGVWFGSP
jgi:hypothetical protein